jgi:hypothetical protein
MYLKLKNRNLWICKQGKFYKQLCFGSLVKDCIALGLSAHPMDVRNLTFQPFVCNMGTLDLATSC